MKRKEIALEVGVSASHLSLVLNGTSQIGRVVAERIAAATGIPWHLVIAMPADELEAELVSRLKIKKIERILLRWGQ